LVSFVCFVFIVLLFLSFSCLSASFYLLSFFLFPCRWRLLLLPVPGIFPCPPFCLPFSLVLLVLFVYICLVTLVYSLFFNFRSLCFLLSVCLFFRLFLFPYFSFSLFFLPPPLIRPMWRSFLPFSAFLVVLRSVSPVPSSSPH